MVTLCLARVPIQRPAWMLAVIWKCKLIFLTVQLALSVTLLPCTSPFAIYVNAEITILGQTTSLVDGNFSANATIPVTLPFVSGTVTVVIIQQDCGILLSVSSHQTTKQGAVTHS